MSPLLASQLRRRLFLAAVLIGMAAVSGFIASQVRHGHTHLSLASSTCTTTGPFCIQSPATGPVLYPGAAASSLPLTFVNYSNVQMNVYQLTVAFTNSFPTGCTPSAFRVSGTALSGSSAPSATISLPSSAWVSVPPASGATPGQATYTPTLALTDNKLNQNSCENLGLNMSYSAQAYYTVPTSTKLVATPNPSTYAQTVALNATVSSGVTPTTAGATPIGSVVFYECTSSSCSTTTTLGTSPVNSSTGVATLSTSFAPTGSYALYAVYNPGCTNTTCTNETGADFKTSTSPQITQVVGYSSCVTTKASGNLTISAGQDICITSTGSQSGNITISSGGRLDLLGGSVGGNITIHSGGGLNFQTGSLSGNLNSTGANVFNVCGARIAGNISVASSSALTLIGLPSGCAGNTVSGNISASSNTAGLEIGGNTVSGNITATSNTGSPETIEGNKVSGGISCTSNTPAPSDSPTANAVSGKRAGQCATPSSF